MNNSIYFEHRPFFMINNNFFPNEKRSPLTDYGLAPEEKSNNFFSDMLNTRDEDTKTVDFFNFEQKEEDCHHQKDEFIDFDRIVQEQKIKQFSDSQEKAKKKAEQRITSVDDLFEILPKADLHTFQDSTSNDNEAQYKIDWESEDESEDFPLQVSQQQLIEIQLLQENPLTFGQANQTNELLQFCQEDIKKTTYSNFLIVEEVKDPQSFVNLVQGQSSHVCQICSREFRRGCELGGHVSRAHSDVLKKKKRRKKRLKQVNVERMLNQGKDVFIIHRC